MSFREQALAAKAEHEATEEIERAERKTYQCEELARTAKVYFERDFDVAPDRIETHYNDNFCEAQATAVKEDVMLELHRNQRFSDHWWSLAWECPACGQTLQSNRVSSLASLGAALEEIEEQRRSHACPQPEGEDAEAFYASVEQPPSEPSPAQMLETIIRRIVRDELGEGLP